MTARYYIYGPAQQVQILRNKLTGQGYKFHQKRDGISRHFHLEKDLIIYIEDNQKEGIAKSVVEFAGDEDMSRLEEIASKLKAIDVVDSMSQTVSFINIPKPEKGYEGYSYRRGRVHREPCC